MHDFARDFPPTPAPIHGAAHGQDLLAALGKTSPWQLADPRLGQPVATSRTSWVRRLIAGTIDCHIKTYVYPRLADRCRGALRNTGPAVASRAAREASALRWLNQQGFPAPPVLLVTEDRSWGFLRRALLVTGTWPGTPLDHLLPTLDAAARHSLACCVGQFVARLHAAGFRDGNLDLRNLLARQDGTAFTLAKVDSPRFAVVAASDRLDGAARRDWARLLPQLAHFDLADVALAAAGIAPGTLR